MFGTSAGVVRSGDGHSLHYFAGENSSSEGFLLLSEFAGELQEWHGPGPNPGRPQPLSRTSSFHWHQACSAQEQHFPLPGDKHVTPYVAAKRGRASNFLPVRAAGCDVVREGRPARRKRLRAGRVRPPQETCQRPVWVCPLLRQHGGNIGGDDRPKVNSTAKCYHSVAVLQHLTTPEHLQPPLTREGREPMNLS